MQILLHWNYIVNTSRNIIQTHKFAWCKGVRNIDNRPLNAFNVADEDSLVDSEISRELVSLNIFITEVVTENCFWKRIRHLTRLLWTKPIWR